MIFKPKHFNQNQPVDINPKSTKAKWIFGFAVFSVATIGLSVPLALTNWQTKIEQPISANEIMYEIKIGNLVHQVTYGDFEKRAQSFVARENQQLIDLTNSFDSAIIGNLYEQEHQAWLKFKAVLEQKNRDLKINQDIKADQYGYDVTKSASKIYQEQEQNLNDAKRGFQSALGGNWESKWLTELQTNPIYGFQALNGQSGQDLAKIETKAIRYMTTQVLKQPALARFEKAQINVDQWTRQDLSWNPSQDISYQDDQGQNQVITKAAAKQMIATMVDLNANAKFSLQSENPLQTVAVFTTQSYLPEFRQPNQLLKTFTKQWFQSAVVSTLTMPIKMGTTNLRALSFPNETLVNWFKINDKPESSLIAPNQFAAILQLSYFQGATITKQSPIQQARDQQLLINLNGRSQSDQPDTGGETPMQTFADENQPNPSDPNRVLGSSKWMITSDLLDSSNEDQNQRWINLLALGNAQTGLLNPEQALFKAKQHNPFNVWIDLLLTINALNDQPDFNVQIGGTRPYQALAKFWSEIKGTGASQPLVNFVNLIKMTFIHKQNSSGLMGIKPSILATYNDDLSAIINQFSEADWSFLGKLLRIALIDPDARLNNVPGQGIVSSQNPMINNYDLASGFWSLYQLGPQTFLNVAQEQMTIFSVEKIDEQDVDAMILSDLERSLQPELKENLLYDVSAIYEKINQEPVIKQLLLQQEELMNRFKYQLIQDLLSDVKVEPFDPKGQFMNNLNEDQKTLINESVMIFQDYIEQQNQLLTSEAQAKGLEKISDLLVGAIETYRYYDFSVVANQNREEAIYWQYDPDTLYQAVAIDPNYWGITNVQRAFINRYLNLFKPDVSK